ncbi:MAG: hypothetical protein Q8Q36_00405, partial [bacterium]|nr:hypothetical protein [bacterium]
MSKIFNISLNDALRLAGLNKTEEAIIGLLKQAKRPLTVGKVQDELKLERLVVFYNLKKLEKRGIAAHDSSRKAHRWALHMPTKETVSSRNHVISIEEAYRMLNESQS